MSDPYRRACEHYRASRGSYENLTTKVVQIIKDLMKLEGINYSNITGRTKDIHSYEAKARDPKYTDPEKQIMDMCGIRIILYTLTDAQKSWELIQKSFDLIPEHTVDKSTELGVDRMGYRSIHCVGKFDSIRAQIPENLLYKDLCFEIQIRTILQHAWAEFEHDRNYKFSGVLPDDIQRQLSIVAGILELSDNEFEKISEKIDVYAVEVGEKTEKGMLDTQITSISLTNFLVKYFNKLIESDLLTTNFSNSERTIEQLNQLGVTTLELFDKLIPEDFRDKIIPILEQYAIPENEGGYDYGLNGVVWDIMLIAFKKEFYDLLGGYPIGMLSSSELDLYKSYDIDYRKW